MIILNIIYIYKSLKKIFKLIDEMILKMTDFHQNMTKENDHQKMMDQVGHR